jgi:hypothetical protein
VFSWAEVSAWLARAKLGDVDHIAAETAKACLIIDAALTVRNGLRELPRHNRPLVRDLVTQPRQHASASGRPAVSGPSGGASSRPARVAVMSLT